ncbi:TnsA-like heteromeric transposase endonuclease subunit [Streptomyces griseofuscus]|uniref:TnsA-like heteromeric transposase endonuclease subunit n=1 Tax=Streptomyces griseofuscus TaxID=146922 RepID=UPI0036AC155B
MDLESAEQGGNTHPGTDRAALQHRHALELGPDGLALEAPRVDPWARRPPPARRQVERGSNFSHHTGCAHYPMSRQAVELGVHSAGRDTEKAGRTDVESVDVVFLAADRTTECSRWLAAAPEVAFEQCPPVQPFPNRKGKRLAPGWWWSSTTGQLVYYGSAAMRLHVMLLDRDPRVSSLAARPLELRWREPSGVRAHAPQLMLRLADGRGMLADCTGRGQLSRRQRSVGAVVGEICSAAGWQYWVLGPVDPVYRRNVTWLAGYRHPRHHGGRLLAEALQEAFAEPAPLWERVRSVGDPLVVLPALFHALWAGRLGADLGVPMHERMPVWAQAAE